MRRGLVAVTVAATTVLLGVAATTARADGDPASDVLIVERVFLGLDTEAAAQERRVLDALTLDAEKRGLPIHVAVIPRATDLGAVPSLFGHAQRYADFLGYELGLAYHGTLVVVMAGTPGGVGVFGPAAKPRARAAVRALVVPSAGSTEALASVATTAVRAVAAANGHPPPAVHSFGPRGGHGLLFGLVGAGVAATIGTGGLVVYRRRR